MIFARFCAILIGNKIVKLVVALVIGISNLFKVKYILELDKTELDLRVRQELMLLAVSVVEQDDYSENGFS